jgi:hypothetical protein
MKIEHTISAQVSEGLLKERASAFLQNAGYRPVNRKGDLVYKRGALLGSLFSFTPKGWRARVVVKTQPGSEGVTEARFRLDIDTTGQMVTEKERLFWKNEMEGLILAVRTGNPISKPALEAAGDSKAQNVASAALVIILAVLMAVIFRATYGTNAAGYLGGVVGTLVGFGVMILALKVRLQK